MTKSTEYHEKEWGYESRPNPVFATGLFGFIMLITIIFVSILVTIFTLPFVLLGFVEVVAESPTNFRVRWIRD